MGAPDCDLVGSRLIFPAGLPEPPVDGPGLAIGPVGASHALQEGDEEIVIANWGVPGVAAALIRDDELIDVWASTPQARDLQVELMRMSDVRGLVARDGNG